MYSWHILGYIENLKLNTFQIQAKTHHQKLVCCLIAGASITRQSFNRRQSDEVYLIHVIFWELALLPSSGFTTLRQ